MNFFYSAAVMGYGNGRFWHKDYSLPVLPMVTKTLTYKKKTGIPFAVLQFGKSVWNKVGLHNIGFFKWLIFLDNIDYKNTIVSLAGTDNEIEKMVRILNSSLNKVKGIELNFSCPNHRSFYNTDIPKSDIPLYLKLNYKQDPYHYDLDKIEGIRLNSVKCKIGAISGKAAQKYNWHFIRKFNYEGLNVAGSSITCNDDIKLMEDYGCTEIGLGSIVLVNPYFVEGLKSEKIQERKNLRFS